LSNNNACIVNYCSSIICNVASLYRESVTKCSKEFYFIVDVQYLPPLELIVVVVFFFFVSVINYQTTRYVIWVKI
jgi:hypothetical protein